MKVVTWLLLFYWDEYLVFTSRRQSLVTDMLMLQWELKILFTITSTLAQTSNLHGRIEPFPHKTNSYNGEDYGNSQVAYFWRICRLDAEDLQTFYTYKPELISTMGVPREVLVVSSWCHTHLFIAGYKVLSNYEIPMNCKLFNFWMLRATPST